MPTACGIETASNCYCFIYCYVGCNSAYRLRYWNTYGSLEVKRLAGCNSAYRLRYWNFACAITEPSPVICCNSAYRLRYWNSDTLYPINIVITSCNSAYRLRYWNTWVLILSALPNWRCNSAYRLRYWNQNKPTKSSRTDNALQQYLPLAVCDEGCEAAEEQSDDEARTSLVPDRREGKTKVMK